jgi:hypothetical protein
MEHPHIQSVCLHPIHWVDEQTCRKGGGFVHGSKQGCRRVHLAKITESLTSTDLFPSPSPSPSLSPSLPAFSGVSGGAKCQTAVCTEQHTLPLA